METPIERKKRPVSSSALPDTTPRRRRSMTATTTTESDSDILRGRSSPPQNDPKTAARRASYGDLPGLPLPKGKVKEFEKATGKGGEGEKAGGEVDTHGAYELDMGGYTPTDDPGTPVSEILRKDPGKLFAGVGPGSGTVGNTPTDTETHLWNMGGTETDSYTK